MALSRADLISQTRKKIETYSDFTNNFYKNPVTNELAVITNEASVTQAFKNLIKTTLGFRMYNPFFGSTIYESLFELDTGFLVEDITNSVMVAASQFEKRVLVLQLNVAIEADTDTIIIYIVFAMINNPKVPLNMKIILNRVR